MQAVRKLSLAGSRVPGTEPPVGVMLPTLLSDEPELKLSLCATLPVDGRRLL